MLGFNVHAQILDELSLPKPYSLIVCLVKNLHLLKIGLTSLVDVRHGVQFPGCLIIYE